jgi:raffinose/stachyose/melibiose transport system substrate-binding protein
MRIPRPRTRRAALVAGFAALSLTLAACAGSSDSGSAAGSSETGSAAADTGTLKLWHYESANGAMGIAWDKAIEIFKTEHPGVTVDFERKAFEQIQQNAGMIISSDEGPDIMEYNKGNATAGLLASQGLLTNLTDQATARGWDKELSPSLQTTAKYDSKGVMGSGDWYGVPNYGEYVMVYYNKDAFAAQGLSVPTTLPEFTAAMDKFVAAGTTPLCMAGAEYPAGQLAYQLALTKADRSFVDDYQLYKNPVDFQADPLKYGADTFDAWVKAGYISQDSASLKAEDMGTGFIGGKCPMIVSGSWWFGRFADEIKGFDWGTFTFPGSQLSLGSSGNIWVVPEASKNKDLAYDFIDITMRPEIQELIGNSGGIPVAADPSKITDPKNAELVANFNKITAADGLAFYPDWPVPGYYDVLVSGFQSLINQSKTPAEVLNQISGPYQEGVATIQAG